jgi:hypothetical protein
MPDLAWWIQNFKESAFRLEALPEYTVPQEADMLARFKRGEQVRLPDDHPWLKLVRGATATRKMQRVRVLCSPLTDYLRFELSVYPQCVEAGEEVRITEGQHMARLGDFWIFDRKAIILLHYDDLGRFIRQTQTDDPAYLDHADLSLTVSTPLERATRRAG